jgi:ribosomal protein S18 acetylase RimI-like enzyme
MIREATSTDLESMWAIFRAVVAAGDTLPFTDAFDRESFRSHWFDTQTSYVATAESRITGMYKIGANYPGLGDHIASATYLVSPAFQGRGIGRALVEHSVVQAERSGFTALLFNYVVSTNASAVELYKKLGFTIVGTLPMAFRHPHLGLVDAFVMFRRLVPPSA